jgi:hypothetical protein
MNKKTTAIAALILASLVLAGVLLAPALEHFITGRLPLKELRALLIENAREKGIDLSIKGVRFELLHGVVFTGVSARLPDQQPFFHGQNLIIPLSPMEAMKKNLSPRVRVVGGRFFHENIGRAQAQDLWAALGRGSRDWKISFDNIALDFRPRRFNISGSIEPDELGARGRLELTLDGRPAASGDLVAREGRTAVRFKLKEMPLQTAVELLPGVLGDASGTLSGKGSISLDELSLAYDIKGEILNFSSRLTPQEQTVQFALNGGYGWKEQMRITSLLTMERSDAKLEMKERLKEAGKGVREVSGTIGRIPGTEKGSADFYWRSSFRSSQTEQLEEIKASVSDLIYKAAEGAVITVEKGDFTANTEMKLSARGSLPGHALEFSLSGPIRFGDRPENFSGGPLRLEGRMDAIDPEKAAQAIFAVHSHLMHQGEAQDAEKAEDTGPLWEQRRRGPVALSLLSSFQINGDITAPGIQGMTQEPVRIFAQKTGASLSANLNHETPESHLKADYSLTFDADLPHQSIRIKYMSSANAVSLKYMFGDPKPPRSLFVDYTTSLDGFLPADLVFKSSSNLFLRAGPLPIAFEPAPLVLSVANLDEKKDLEELEIQRVTEGGRTIWAKITAKRADESATGSGEFGSDGGKAVFYLLAGGKSSRVDLGLTEAGKWYPHEN